MDMAQLQFLLDVNRKEGAYIPYHYHHCCEMVYYREGSGTTCCFTPRQTPHSERVSTYETPDFRDGEKEEIPFERNTLVIYPPYTYHDEVHREMGDVLAFGFFADATALTGISTYRELPPDAVQLLQSIAREYAGKPRDYLPAINHLIDLLLICLSRADNKQVSRPGLETVKNYMDNYFMTDITISQLAKSTYYSTDHFIRVFQKEFGLHPKQYLQKLRLEESLKLLSGTELLMGEIAKRVGFGSSGEFSAFIKKFTGKSPTEIRRSGCHFPHKGV
jgi:AraC family transcriptional activator of pobA